MNSLLNTISLTLNSAVQNPIILLPFFILEEFGVPFPWILSGLFLYSGYRFSQGDMMVLWMIPVNILGGFIGSSSLYWMSRLGLLKVFGRFNRFLHRQNSQSSDSRIHSYVKKWGPLSVLIGRMLPIPMPLITITAGVFKISYVPFLIFAATSNFLWNALYMSAGMFTGTTHRFLISNLGKTAALTVVLLIVAVAIFLVIFLKMRAQSRSRLKENQ